MVLNLVVFFKKINLLVKVDLDKLKNIMLEMEIIKMKLVFLKPFQRD